jgi:hypothetical protein
VNHLSVEPVLQKKAGKDTKEAKDAKDAKEAPIVARLRITGVTTTSKDDKLAKDALVQHLRDAIGRDTHLKATIEKWVGATHEFTIRIDVTKQPASKYLTVLALPAEATRTGPQAKFQPRRDDEGDDDE